MDGRGASFLRVVSQDDFTEELAFEMRPSRCEASQAKGIVESAEPSRTF